MGQEGLKSFSWRVPGIGRCCSRLPLKLGQAESRFLLLSRTAVVRKPWLSRSQPGCGSWERWRAEEGMHSDTIRVHTGTLQLDAQSWILPL